MVRDASQKREPPSRFCEASRTASMPFLDYHLPEHLIAQEPVRPYAVIAIVSTQSIQIERARRGLIKLGGA